MLRTALSLASVTGMPCRVRNIRAGRERAGLRPQHALSARAAAAVTGGRLEGCAEGSRELTYLPGRPTPGPYSFALGTAGSVTLVFQALLPVLAFSGGRSTLSLTGGTHVPWSPPADYMEEVFLPALSVMGVDAAFSTVRRGYYPAGGGLVEASTGPASAPLRPLVAVKRGPLERLRLVSTVSNLPMSIAGRQLEGAAALLSGFPGALEAETKEAPSSGKGTSVFMLARFEGAVAGFTALGAPGKRAEEVGAEAARAFLDYMATDGALDARLADQLAMYMALAAGRSEATTSRITGHLLTNIHVIESFLPIRFEVDGVAGAPGRVAVKGAGLPAPSVSG